VTTAAFSPDGRRVLTASYEHTARIYRILTANEIDQLLSAK
jgi:WD40 repeat protein